MSQKPTQWEGMCSETVYPICSATGVSVTAPALLHFLSLSLPIAKRNRPENLECMTEGGNWGHHRSIQHSPVMQHPSLPPDSTEQTHAGAEASDVQRA